jgi:hypothetical protein
MHTFFFGILFKSQEALIPTGGAGCHGQRSYAAHAFEQIHGRREVQTAVAFGVRRHVAAFMVGNKLPTNAAGSKAQACNVFPKKSGQALNPPHTQVRLFLVQVRANKKPTVGGNMLPPMESDNVLSHSKAVAFFVQKYFPAYATTPTGLPNRFHRFQNLRE